MDMQQWPVPPSLLVSKEVTLRNRIAEKYRERPAEEIMTAYAGMAKDDILRYFPAMLARVGVLLGGAGIETGAGVGVFSASVVASCPAVTKLYALEIVPQVVNCLQEPVISAIAGPAAKKVVRVHGSFDDIQLPTASLDFALELEALHHSPDLDCTLREIARVLKPGGYLLCVDRVCSNQMTNRERDYLLDYEYSDAWKRANDYPVSETITRRQNGEHEIRQSEWEAGLARAGFSVERLCFTRTADPERILKCLVGLIPFALRRPFGWKFGRLVPCHQGEIWWQIRRCLFGTVPRSSRFLDIPVSTPVQRVLFSKTVLVCRKRDRPV